MKKMITLFVLACAFSAANATMDAKTMAFVQPFNKSYALDGPYLWYTDPDYTNPTGSYCDIFYEINRLHACFPGYSFSHVPYAGLNDFEYGIASPWYYATIYSDLSR
jgi:hypothetical protein